MPHWGCQKCGRTSNWACRLQCQCGQKAPKHVLDRAKTFSNGAGSGGPAPRGGPGSGTHVLGDKRQAKLEK
eukprot:1579879-Pyramimonas_sp.AAC.1